MPYKRTDNTFVVYLIIVRNVIFISHRFLIVLFFNIFQVFFSLFLFNTVIWWIGVSNKSGSVWIFNTHRITFFHFSRATSQEINILIQMVLCCWTNFNIIRLMLCCNLKALSSIISNNSLHHSKLNNIKILEESQIWTIFKSYNIFPNWHQSVFTGNLNWVIYKGKNAFFLFLSPEIFLVDNKSV